MPLWLENILCIIQIPFYLLRLVLWSWIRSVFLNSLCVFKRNVYLLLLDRRFCKYQLGQTGWWCRSNLFYAHWFFLSSCCISYWEGILTFWTVTVSLSISFLVLSIFTSYLLKLIISCINIYDCYVFSENWLLLIHTLTLFLVIFFVQKSIWSDIKIGRYYYSINLLFIEEESKVKCLA